MIVLAAIVGCGPPPLDPPARIALERTAAPIRIVATGDVGRDTPTARRVAHAMHAVCAEQGCDLGLLLGDLLYDRGMQAPDDPRMDSQIRDRYREIVDDWYLVHGNHDYAHGRNLQRAQWQRQWAQRTPGFHMPTPDWRLDVGHATVLGLDTTRVFWDGDRTRSEWLKTQRPELDSTWTIVAAHHPYRSNGAHGNAGEYEGWSGLPWVSGRALERLYRTQICGTADLVLTAHDHNLQWIEECGTQWIVTGAGAHPKPIVDRGNRARFQSDKAGFAWIELGDRMRIQFHDVEGRVLHEGICCDKPSIVP